MRRNRNANRTAPPPSFGRRGRDGFDDPRVEAGGASGNIDKGLHSHAGGRARAVLFRSQACAHRHHRRKAGPVRRLLSPSSLRYRTVIPRFSFELEGGGSGARPPPSLRADPDSSTTSRTRSSSTSRRPREILIRFWTTTCKATRSALRTATLRFGSEAWSQQVREVKQKRHPSSPSFTGGIGL